MVAPHAGAWIETGQKPRYTAASRVSPLAGAWIETMMSYGGGVHKPVAPLAGAWIAPSYLRIKFT